MSYDQWKTASPYDDCPDVVDECLKVAMKLNRYVQTHSDLSDITREEKQLLEQAKDTLRVAAEWIEEDESYIQKNHKTNKTIGNILADRDKLLDIIRLAPHAFDCCIEYGGNACDCFKSKADG